MTRTSCLLWSMHLCSCVPIYFIVLNIVVQLFTVSIIQCIVDHKLVQLTAGLSYNYIRGLMIKNGGNRPLGCNLVVGLRTRMPKK